MKFRVLFWRCACAETETMFEICLHSISTLNPEAAEYINQISLRQWATYAFLGSRYGHCASNLAEVANSVLQEIMTLPTLELLRALYNHQMQNFYSRFIMSRSIDSIPLVPRAADKLRKVLHEFRTLCVIPATPLSGLVRNSQGKDFAIVLPDQGAAGYCTCGFYQQNRFPCSHACALAVEVSTAPISRGSVLHIGSVLPHISTTIRSSFNLGSRTRKYRSPFP
jgi:SWIM zinc finger